MGATPKRVDNLSTLMPKTKPPRPALMLAPSGATQSGERKPPIPPTPVLGRRTTYIPTFSVQNGPLLVNLSQPKRQRA